MARPDLSSIVDELVTGGAAVVWLAGSYARGDAGPHSDIDVGVLASESQRRPRVFRLYEGVPMSIVWTTAAATRASFRDPAQLGAAVPGWRGALLLHDAGGVGAALKREANAWTWTDIEEACDAWVAREITQLGEEIHKVLNALASADDVVAASRRNALVGRLPLVMSVRRRILYDSEKRIWDLVSAELSDRWRRDQRQALAAGGEHLNVSVNAALRLYLNAASECAALLSDEQREVIECALGLIRGLDAGGRQTRRRTTV